MQMQHQGSSSSSSAWGLRKSGMEEVRYRWSRESGARLCVARVGMPVWGFSHLSLCPAGLGLGSRSWFHRDVKATCLIQGSFLSEL